VEDVDEEAQVRRDANLLMQFLQTDPTTRAYIDRTIRQHLQRGVSSETWADILNGLTLYAGEDVTRFVLTILLSADELLDPDSSGYLDLVRENIREETWVYLRSLLAMYSAGIKEAYALAGENPHAWRMVNRRVFYDQLTERWQTTLEVIKYSGERFYLEETPTSAIGLCSAILDALNFVPPEEAQQVADRRAVEELIGLFYAFVERFAPDFLEEGQEE
jgi:hypothetical protein